MRRVKEGTSAVLLQSGLDENWWADSMECFSYLRNIQDLLSDGKTPYERRFGQPFKGPIIPFGSLVEYHPITAEDQSRIHHFGKKVLPGLLSGYALYAVTIWKGDILVVDIEELETMDASEIYSKRLNAKGVIFPKENGNFIFPVADGRIKLSGGDQDLRTSTLIWERPIRGESHADFLGESEGSLPKPQDSFPDAGEAMNDFWWPGRWGPQGMPKTGMECYTYLRNVQDLLFDGKTPYERRFEEPFEGPLIPSGAMVEDHPISAKDLSRLHQFGRYIPRNPCEKTQCKGSINAPKWGKTYFPGRRWNSQTIWRRSGSENIHLNLGQLRPSRRARKSSRRIRRVFFNSISRLIAG